MSTPLSEDERRRGRWLAIVSHPIGMIHRQATNEHLPTLALVALGAGADLVGMQRSLALVAILAQLPTLRRVGRIAKRHILVTGQSIAVLGTLPLLAFGWLGELGASGPFIALAAFALTATGLGISGTVWFPLLHGYVEPARIGRFFGTLRTGWHLTLIFYFLGARAWLEARPGDFGPLFALAAAMGLARIALIARLPERSEQTGQSISIGAAVRAMRARPGWSRYMAGTILGGGVRGVFIAFAIVAMRRVLGLSEAEVIYSTVAVYAGGLVSLYPWGRVVDALGPAPVFVFTAIGQAAVMIGFASLGASDAGVVVWAVCAMFALSVLASGFDVADTRVLFGMTSEETPARLIVPTNVLNSLLRGVLPLLTGLTLQRSLDGGVSATEAYRVLFIGLAIVEMTAIGPLRHFRRAA